MLKTSLRVLLTGAVVLVAVAVVAYKYWDYLINPWTRDGQVRAQVVQVTPRVSAPIVNLPIVDQYESLIVQQQAVIDANEASLADATANFERMTKAGETGAVARQSVDDAKANFDIAVASLSRAQAQMIEAFAQRAQSEADLAEARAQLGAPGEDNARLRAAKAAVRSAELDLEFTRVVAPVDGYVTNLALRLGDQAVENTPALALVDVNSYWIHGFFKENWIADIRPGDRAIVTLMTYPDRPLEGRVDSVGWGISQDDGSTGFDLLPDIDATFEWIRLAQRVPVRVHLVDMPEDIRLRVGTTTSVLVMTGTSENPHDGPVPPVPRPLQ